MKILKFLLILLVVVGLVWLVASLMGPKDYRVVRSAIVHANDSITHDYISHFEKWGAWSPWKEMDPEAKYSITGTDGTVGAVHNWEGEVTGKGSMTLTEVTPNSIQYDLAFVAPWESKSSGGFTLENAGNNQTKVTWTDQGDIPFSQRAMFMVMNMEKMMGPQFKRGLFKIDSLASYDQNTMILEQGAQ